MSEDKLLSGAKKIPVKGDAFIEGEKKKHNSVQEDAESLKAKDFKMESLIDGLKEMPERVRIDGPVRYESVKPPKKDENPEHGGTGKSMF